MTPVTCNADRRAERTPARAVCLLAVSVVLQGCSWRLVPLQMARFSQIEQYTQTFSFADESALDQNRSMESCFAGMLGSDNWQNLKDVYGFEALRDELVGKRVYLSGTIEFSIFLDPVDAERFQVEGLGRYFLVRGKTGEILLNGDFRIPPQRYSRADLNRGSLDVGVKLVVTRIPGIVSRLHDAPLIYRVFFNTERAGSGVYLLDYERSHQAYLDRDGNHILDGKERIGELKLEDRGRGALAMLIDFRGTGFVRRYED